MGQVSIALMGRNYRFVCGDGEEVRIKALAEYVRVKVDKLTAEMGRQGDDRLLMMAALMITDELFEARGTAIEGAPSSGQGGSSRSKKPNIA